MLTNGCAFYVIDVMLKTFDRIWCITTSVSCSSFVAVMYEMIFIIHSELMDLHLKFSVRFMHAN